MNVTEQDRAAGFKDIRIAMLDGKFEVVRVSAPTPEKLVETMSQKPSQKMVFDFITSATGKDLKFVLEMNPASYVDVFITACGLCGLEISAQQSAIEAALTMIERATHRGS
jgi:hypothetical protein